MKKMKFAFILVSVLFSSLANAQTEYEWDLYGIGFSVTEDFEVTVNNSEEFSASSSDDLIDISIFPWADENLDKDDLDDYLIQIATDIVGDTDDMAAGELEIDDFAGSFLVASKDDEIVLVAILLDEESETNFIVQISFVDGLQEEVLEIVGSFYAFDL